MGLFKIFKKVVQAVKKVALPVLAIGAVVLTGGAALGVLPAVGSVVGGLGLGTAVTGILTSAVTTAGYSAMVGGVVGGKKGFMQGAALGAVGGGAIGAANVALAGAGATKGATAATQAATQGAGAATQGATAATQAATQGAGAATQGAAAAMNPASIVDMGRLAATSMTPVAVPTITAPAAVRPGPALSGFGSFAKANPQLVGQVMQGVGGALAGGDEVNPYEEARRNYSATPVAYEVPNTGFGAGGRWEFDPQQNKLVYRKASPYAPTAFA